MNIQECTTFTRWTTTAESKKLRGNIYVLCVCQCGTQRYVREAKLLGGKSQSCGCLRDENLTTHGQTKRSIRAESHEYWIWNSMLQRTTNPQNVGYKNYGGRGVGVCDAWMVFENFFADMGARTSEKLSLERVDNNKGYSPDNCRWATRVEQNRNKRNTRLLTANGVTKHLAEWARDIGASHATILHRIKSGWDVEKAVTTPPRKMGNRT